MKLSPDHVDEYLSELGALLPSRTPISAGDGDGPIPTGIGTHMRRVVHEPLTFQSVPAHVYDAVRGTISYDDPESVADGAQLLEWEAAGNVGAEGANVALPWLARLRANLPFGCAHFDAGDVEAGPYYLVEEIQVLVVLLYSRLRAAGGQVEDQEAWQRFPTAS